MHIDRVRNDVIAHLIRGVPSADLCSATNMASGDLGQMPSQPQPRPDFLGSTPRPLSHRGVAPSKIRVSITFLIRRCETRREFESQPSDAESRGRARVPEACVW